ncbi:MAG: hypothetical protein RI925_985 [Pseudomonadota bacterium]
MSLPVSSEIPLPDGSAEAASAAGRPVRMPLLAVLDPALMAHYVPRVAAPIPPVPTPPASPARPGRARRVVEEDPLLQRFNQRFIAAGHPANSLQLNRKQQVVATFDEWQLSSVFQPIVAAQSQQVIGHKALLRITGPAGHAVAAPLLFAVERAPARTVLLDRLCRVVHSLNFVRRGLVGVPLHLNVHALHLLNLPEGHGEFFAEAIAELGLLPSQVTLEIVDEEECDLLRLQRCIQSYRRFGFRIALDDFGVSELSLPRVWLLEPDAVKLHERLLHRALSIPCARAALPQAVTVLHQAGCQVVAEGVDSARHAELAREAGCDGLQGSWVSKLLPAVSR